jgi:hypothetical protein
MRLKPRRRFIKPRDTVDLAVAAYVAWREECIAVRNAYLTWRRARADEAALAFDAYEAALDREEAAANIYAELMRRVGYLVATGLARQPAYPPSTPGVQA